MCLLWFEGPDRWCPLCAVTSCFTVRLQERGIIQEAFDFKVEWLVEQVRRHLCDLVLWVGWGSLLNAGVGRFDDCSIYTFFKRRLTYRSWTRNATRNLYRVRDSSSLFECVMEISRMATRNSLVNDDAMLNPAPPAKFGVCRFFYCQCWSMTIYSTRG